MEELTRIMAQRTRALLAPASCEVEIQWKSLAEVCTAEWAIHQSMGRDRPEQQFGRNLQAGPRRTRGCEWIAIEKEKQRHNVRR